MEATLCKNCKQVHRDDYRVWSDYYQQWLSIEEFLKLVKTLERSPEKWWN